MSEWYARTVFFVSDCANAISFYQSIGFTEDWRSEEAGRLIAVQMSLHGIEIILNEDHAKAGNGRLFISLDPGEVNQYLRTITINNQKIDNFFWGMPTKRIVDPDGNELLLFDDELIKAK